MKKILKLSLLCLLLSASSCSYNYRTSIVEDNVKSYSTTWDEIVNKGNTTLFNSAFSPNVIYDNPTTHLEGIDEVRKYFNEYLTGFSNRNFKVLEIYGEDDRVIKRWSFTGTHTGDFAGIKATGKRITIEGVSIATIRYGKIIAEREYTDDLGMMQQLGVVAKI